MGLFDDRPLDLMGFLDSGYFEREEAKALANLPEVLRWDLDRDYPAEGAGGDPPDFRESAASVDGGMPYVANRTAINETELLSGMAQAARMAFHWAKNGISEGRYERGLSRERELPYAFLVNPVDKMALQMFVAEANDVLVFELGRKAQMFEGCILAAADFVPERRFALLDEPDYRCLLASCRQR